MNVKLPVYGTAAIALVLSSGVCGAADNAQNGPAAATASGLATITYRPPLRGAPQVRIDAASRGADLSLASLWVLAPDHAGLTVKERPSLFWCQSQPASAKLELTIIEEGKAKPWLEVAIPRLTRAGIHKFMLSKHQAGKLAANIEYQWTVALVPDLENRSKDVVASGVIKRVEAPADLSARIAKASKSELPAIYAEAGMWYDALESLSDLIDADPGNTTLRKQRATLLEQVGLAKASTYDIAVTPR